MFPSVECLSYRSFSGLTEADSEAIIGITPQLSTLRIRTDYPHAIPSALMASILAAGGRLESLEVTHIGPGNIPTDLAIQSPEHILPSLFLYPPQIQVVRRTISPWPTDRTPPMKLRLAQALEEGTAKHMRDFIQLRGITRMQVPRWMRDARRDADGWAESCAFATRRWARHGLLLEYGESHPFFGENGGDKMRWIGGKPPNV